LGNEVETAGCIVSASHIASIVFRTIASLSCLDKCLAGDHSANGEKQGGHFDGP
jgi:hypothetical protein